MSLKRSHADRGPHTKTDDSNAKVDRQELWDELQRWAKSGEPFSPTEISVGVGAPEAAVSRVLLHLAFEHILEKVDGGRYRATPLVEREVKQSDFNKALATKIDPRHQQDMLEIERLKQNNNEMRRRLLDAVAERDRYLALMKKHGIDPAEEP